MNVFTSGQSHQSWVWQVTALCFVLGVLLMGSLRTVSEVKRSGSGAIRVGVPPGGGVRPEMVRKLEKEIADLRESKTTLENTLAKGNDQVKALNDELQKVKVLAGLTPVTGAGIVLTLEDSKRGPPTNRAFEQDKYIIHDYDLQQAVHELLASGAEAVAVNDQRVTSRTAIRCVGPTVQVNFVSVVPPFVISAIGDPNALLGGLSLPNGFIDNLRRYDPAMVAVEKRARIALPAYSGSTEMRYTKPIIDTASAENGAGTRQQ